VSSAASARLAEAIDAWGRSGEPSRTGAPLVLPGRKRSRLKSAACGLVFARPFELRGSTQFDSWSNHLALHPDLLPKLINTQAFRPFIQIRQIERLALNLVHPQGVLELLLTATGQFDPAKFG